MKKIILAFAVIVASLSSFASGPGVDEKVLEAFNRTFQDATDITWAEHENRFEVNFKQNSMQIKVNYDKEGNIINTLRYYNEEHLPLIVLSKVKTKYSDKKIFGVTEFSSAEGTYYYIMLEGDKSWVEVKADVFGGMSVQKKMKKG